MTFLQPLGLLGLLALPAILLLHLLRERSRKEVVPSLELWAWLEEEVRGPKPQRLPWTWILFLQLLAAVALSAALLRPRLSLVTPPAGNQRLILVVDTSASMGALDVRPSRLAQAQAHAAAILATLDSGDSAVLIGAGPTAARMGDSTQIGVSGVAARLADLQPLGAGHDWPGALALAAASTAPGRTNRIVVLTDGAFTLPGSMDTTAWPMGIEWDLVGAPQPNQAVVTLAAGPSESGAVQVFARVANFSDEPAQRIITLLADGAVVDSHRVTLDPSGGVGQSWTLPPGAASVEVRLSDADALPADDRAALGVLGGQTVDALLVADKPADVERALRAIPGVRLRVVGPQNYVAYEPHDLTVFRGWLPGAWPQGGVLVFEPPSGSEILPSSGTLEVGDIDRQPSDPLFADVGVEHVTFGGATRLQTPTWLSPVLSDADGLELAWRGAVGASRVVVLAFTLADSNITRRPAFPVLIANAVAGLLPPPLPESIRPGEAIPLPAAHVFPSLTLTDPGGREFTFGTDRPASFDDTFRPGLYALTAQMPSGDEWNFGVGVNVGAPEESDLRLQAHPEFGTPGGSTEPMATAGGSGLALWPFVAAVVLIFLHLEARLAWR